MERRMEGREGMRDGRKGEGEGKGRENHF